MTMLLQVKHSKSMQFWEQKKSEKYAVIIKCIHTDTKLATRNIVQIMSCWLWFNHSTSYYSKKNTWDHITI